MAKGSDSHDFTVKETFNGQVRYVALDIALIDDRALEYFTKVWQKMTNAVVSFHELYADEERPSWTKWQVSKWSTERVDPPRLRFGAWHGPVLAGFVNLRSEFESQVKPGRQITYVEHLAASPGCLTTRLWNRALSRVGQALLAFAVYKSIENGHKGVIGLHAADASASIWYDGLNRQFGNRLFCDARSDVAGFYERSSQLPYYETDPSGALELLESYRNG